MWSRVEVRPGMDPRVLGPVCFSGVTCSLSRCCPLTSTPPAISTKAKPGHSFPASLSLPCLGKALLVCRRDDSFLCHPLTPLGPSSCSHPLCAARMEPSCGLCEALRHWISSRPSKAKRSRGLITTDRRETGSNCPRAEDKNTLLLLIL